MNLLGYYDPYENRCSVSHTLRLESFFNRFFSHLFSDLGKIRRKIPAHTVVHSL
jgi:hypothetical protein